MYNGDVGGVSGNNNIRWSRELAKELDKADGKEDGLISKNVWDGYLRKMGSSGNTVRWAISIENAEKSFEYYQNKKDVGKADWNTWNDKLNELKESLGLKVENNTSSTSAQNSTPTSAPAPASANSPVPAPVSAPAPAQTEEPQSSQTNQSVKPQYTYAGDMALPEGCTSKYENGVSTVYDKEGHKLMSREYASAIVTGVLDKKTYNTTYYNPDGSVQGTAECSIDDDGYIAYNFKDADGNAVGSAKVAGGRSEIIITDADGKELEHIKTHMMTKEMPTQIMNDMFKVFPFKKGEQSTSAQLSNSVADTVGVEPSNTPIDERLQYIMHNVLNLKPQQPLTPEQELRQLTETLIDNSKISVRKDSRFGTCYSCRGCESNSEQMAKDIATTNLKTLVDNKGMYLELKQKDPKELSNDDKLEIWAYEQCLQKLQLTIDNAGNIVNIENCEYV